MSGPLDDEPIGIDADAPEADWIEQHQPVSDEDDADVDEGAVREDGADISIESDKPEADWIEQHQSIVAAADEERVFLNDLSEQFEDAGELKEEDPIITDQTVGAADDQEVPAPPVSPGARGCNVLIAIAHAVMRSGYDAAQQLERRNRRPPG